MVSMSRDQLISLRIERYQRIIDTHHLDVQPLHTPT